MTSLSNRIEQPLQLRQPGLQEKTARASVRARADEVEVLLPAREIAGRDSRDGEAVGDVGDRAVQTRAAFRHRRDFDRELREKRAVGTIAGERGDAVGV